VLLIQAADIFPRLRRRRRAPTSLSISDIGREEDVGAAGNKRPHLRRRSSLCPDI
jgi:hypothetical protein